MKSRLTRTFVCVTVLLFARSFNAQNTKTAGPTLGFRDPAAEVKWEQIFLAAPDPKLAEEHMRTLTAEPHVSGSTGDRKNAEYVAEKFREAGLQTEIVAYNVYMNLPVEVRVSEVAPEVKEILGPNPERVSGDAYENNPEIVVAFNGYSPSGEVEGDAVYANYGRPEDFDKLKQLGVDVRGKIVIARYGQNFRGVKAYVAQQRGAAGLIIYSDPMDDGYFMGDPYPKGPWRPESGVQRGSIGYMFMYPGDPTTPGIASTPDLPDSKRTSPEKAASLPRIPTTPLSWGDARPILAGLTGPESPREWQGALPFTYHVGPGPVHVKLHLKQEYLYRTMWDVIGKIPGSSEPEEWVVAGNHRDAWVYGAVDPGSGTTAMLEAVHGLGALLKSGWKPRRTVVIGSWDGEEQALVGSTEWGEQNAQALNNAVAYFNIDVGVSGKNFGASAEPTLKQFIREITKVVPSPQGGTVYDAWRHGQPSAASPQPDVAGVQTRLPVVQVGNDVPVGDLGSGSDYTVFLQHLGVPSTDMGSTGSYGVYHSAFDDFAWFTKFGDPNFLYEQQMARVYGLEIVRMADADVLPYDFETYGKEIEGYIDAARKRAATTFAGKEPDFTAVTDAARRFTQAGKRIAQLQLDARGETGRLNRAMHQAELALLLPDGLPNRPWFRHAIYAPGEYTGYAAVVIPGVNEAIDAKDPARTQQQLAALTAAIQRAVAALESYR